MSERQEGICSQSQFSQPHGWKEFAVSLNRDPLVIYTGAAVRRPRLTDHSGKSDAKSQAAQGLITLNETQLAGGAGGARAGPDPRTRLPGAEGLPRCAWPCCPSPTGLGLGTPRILGQPVWPVLETGHLLCSTARQAQGCPRPRSFLLPRSLELPETPGAMGFHSFCGDTKAQTDRACPMQPWGWFWGCCGPWPGPLATVSSWRLRAHNIGHGSYLQRPHVVQISSPGLLELIKCFPRVY